MISEELFTVIFAFVISIVFTAWIIPKIILVSFRKKLFDFQDERKVHVGIVPRLGGIAFVPSIIISLSLIIGSDILLCGGAAASNFNAVQLSLGLCAIMLLYFEGIMDDLIGLGYRVKFIFQVISACLLALSGVWLNDLHGLFGVYEMSPYVGMPLSVLIVVFLINAINLIDGIDGLASGLSIIASLFFGEVFCYVDLWEYAALSFATLGTLCAFFYYNVFGDVEKRRKIFMGDTGSQCIGLILGFLAVRMSMRNPEPECNIEGSIIIAFSMLLVPAFDVIRVMIHRARHKDNIFKPDRNHIHHKFLALGCPHKMTMVIILLISMFFIMLNFVLLSRVDINIILVCDILIYTVLNVILTRAINKKNANMIKE